MMENERDIDLNIEGEPDLKVETPKMYKVVLHNDDFTTMDFVVFILEKVFHKASEEANQIMLTVHNQGQGTCGVYTFEVAETKVAMVHNTAKQYEFPLRCTMETV